jgi:hypothetical protein
MKKKNKTDKSPVATPPPAPKSLPANIQETILGEVRQTISRPITKLPIHKDIPRFAKNFAVFDCTAKESSDVSVFDGAKFSSLSLPAAISALLNALASVLDSDKVC